MSRPVLVELDARVAPPTTGQTLRAIRATVHAAAEKALQQREDMFLPRGDVTALLAGSVACVKRAWLTLDYDNDAAGKVSLSSARLLTRVYVCREDETAESGSEGTDADGDDEDAEGRGTGEARDELGRKLCSKAVVTELPSARLDGVLERLHFAAGVKKGLLGYMGTGWLLGKRGICAEVVRWGGVVLLHGPPGTGKTSLCRGVAQRMAIRAGARDAVLVEVKMEKVLSKWFSESCRTVKGIFDDVCRLSETRGLVVVMLDEVETVALSRKGRTDGGEPGDAVRVVNAMLAGVDAARERGNCVVLATSNLVEGIDEALVDRADRVVCVGRPGVRARESILSEVVGELIAGGVVQRGAETEVESVAKACEGVSGRALRRMAVAALGDLAVGEDELPVGKQVFWEAVKHVVEVEQEAGRAGGM